MKKLLLVTLVVSSIIIAPLPTAMPAQGAPLAPRTTSSAILNASSALFGPLRQEQGAPSPFTGAIILSDTADGAHSVQSADLDADGRPDVVAASREDGQIVWHRNRGGNQFSPRLMAVAPGTYMIVLTDINRDGRIDIVGAAVGELAPSSPVGEDAPTAGGGSIFWLQNNLPASANFTRHDVAVNLNYPVAVHAGDLDGDGDPDLMATTRDDHQVLWFENNGAGDVPAFAPRVITNSLLSAVSVHAGDLDNDGHLDVVAAGEDANQIIWFRNNGARPPAFEPHFVRNGPVPDPTFDYAKSVFVEDINDDGLDDIVFASEEENLVGWYENQGRGATFVEHVLATDVLHAKLVSAADLDNDGDADILAASTDDFTVAYYANDGGAQPGFTRHVITNSAVGARSVSAADMDGDGDFDVLTASRDDDRVMLYVNNTIHRSAVMAGERIVATYRQMRSVASADMDNDGDQDILSVAGQAVAWQENMGGSPPNFSAHLIADNLSAGRWVSVGDIDGDGDTDVVAADHDANTIWWYQNQFAPGGVVSFVARVVATGVSGVRDAHVADIDGDGDNDLYSASDGDDAISWYENIDGQGGSFVRRIVTQNADYARSSYAADVDGDGRVDLMSASARDNTVAWYRNLGGGAFAEFTVATDAIGAQFIYANDIDGDGDIDLLSSSERDNTIAWYANRLRVGRGFEKFIVSNNAPGVHAAIAVDVDMDGDQDIVAAVEYTDQIIWYESSGGFTPAFTPHLVSPFADIAHGVFADDIDGDGDVDILSASRGDGKVAWYENLGGQYSLGESQSNAAAAGQQVMLALDLVHQGRPGDTPVALKAITLRFESRDGQRLTAEQVAAFFSTLSIYRDNGDRQFTPGVDPLLASQSTFPVNNGEMTIALADGQVPAAGTASYFVAVQSNGGVCGTDQVRMSAVTNSRTAADSTTEAPLLAQYMRSLSDSGDPTLGRKPAIFINELMANNVSTLLDPQEAAEYPDWFELHNTSEFYVDLGGMYLSDDPADVKKYRIPDGMAIPPFGYIVFIADGEPEQGANHTNFGLSRQGESLVLYDIDARGNQAIDLVEYDAALPDVSYGRTLADTAVWRNLSKATPGQFNIEQALDSTVYLPSVLTPNACN